MIRKEVTTEHPSYGVISVSRRTGGGNLFGTYVYHQERIAVTISEADHIRADLGYDRVYARKKLIEIELSPEQWVEAITNTNGMGTACTLRQFDGETRPEPPETINVQKRSMDEFKQEMAELAKEFNSEVANVLPLLEKKTALNREEKSVIQNALTMLQRHLNDATPFMREMFNEELDKAVTEAKIQIETAAIQTAARQGEIAKAIVEQAIQQGLEVNFKEQSKITERPEQ